MWLAVPNRAHLSADWAQKLAHSIGVPALITYRNKPNNLNLSSAKSGHDRFGLWKVLVLASS